MRKELKTRGVEALKVVYSEELPVLRRRVPASIAFVPLWRGLSWQGK